MRIATLAGALERAVGRIEGDKRIDGIADKVTPILHRALPSGPVKDVASGTPLGHPLHPALVAVPIGSWIAAAYLDIAGGRGMWRAAQRLVGFGALSALPAATTGISDWLDTTDAERRVGAVHASLNTTALSLYGVSWLARRRGHHTIGVAVSFLGAGLTGAAGWLGGHLAYARGVGVDTTVFEEFPSKFTDAAPLADLADGALAGVAVDGEPVLLAEEDGSVRALADRCTHRGGPLHEGERVDGCVVCPWHQSRFRLRDGSVVRGPAVRPQPVLETRTQDGRVQVCRAR
ncbi:MAG: putative iron-sulfur protein [Ilumatobacteraceae bacterium]|nr:putative iron-sulfur protein [Ilumatobacteraceae bacterium]